MRPSLEDDCREIDPEKPTAPRRQTQGRRKPRDASVSTPIRSSHVSPSGVNRERQFPRRFRLAWILTAARTGLRTMFHATMAAAIDGARTLAQMDELSRQIWQAHASGVVDDAGAQSLAERLHERRGSIRAGIVPMGVPAGRVSLFPPRRRPVSSDRIASRDRRRLLACSGPMPPALAARFTTGQLAV